MNTTRYNFDFQTSERRLKFTKYAFRHNRSVASMLRELIDRAMADEPKTIEQVAAEPPLEPKRDTCPFCEGTGKEEEVEKYGESCVWCKGTGQVYSCPASP